MLFRSNRRKIFVIGRNKSGTTSIGAAIASLGFKLGNQSGAELLMEDWARRDFRNIVKYCGTADAFQDVPFSLDYTYQIMDHAFPGARFILTMRSSSLEWYESLTRFHTRIVGKNRLPTAKDLAQFPYRNTGWLWRSHQLVYGVDEKTLYDKTIYIRHYESHNSKVIEYFRHRVKDLLVLNVAAPDAMRALCDFLGVRSSNHAMPHLNRSTDDRRRDRRENAGDGDYAI